MAEEKKKPNWIDQVAQALNRTVYGAIDTSVDTASKLYDDVKNYFYPQPKLAQPPIPGGGTGSPVKRDALSEMLEPDKNKILEDRRKVELRKQGLL